MDADPKAARQRIELTRRSMLKLAGAGAATAGLWLVDERTGVLRTVRELVDPENAASPLSADHSIWVHRRDDMLDLNFEFYNLQLMTDAPGARLTPLQANTGSNTFVVVGFPSQAIGEESVQENAIGAPPAPPPPVRALLSDRTRVAFTIPTTVTSIPYTVDALLAWTAWSLKCPATALPPGANPPSGPAIAEPTATETAIEVPWRLVLAPDPNLTFAHAPAPVVHGARTELWHTRLAIKGANGLPDERSKTVPTVRAVWSPDVGLPDAQAEIFTESGRSTPVLRRERREIVHQTVNYAVDGRQDPINAKRLFLSPLGAWSDLDGEWQLHGVGLPPNTPPLSVIEFENRGTQGRDHYVKVVNAGFLFPFGHFAVKIAVTERKLQRANGSGARGAYLRKKIFIVVRQPVRIYPAEGQDHGGRALPFTSVRLTNLITPPLDEFEPSGLPVAAYVNANDPHAMWPRVLGEDFQWGIEAIDYEGRRVGWTMPLIWVLGGDAVGTPAVTDALRNYYNALELDDPRRARPLGGQKLAYAPVGTGKGGSTAYDTASMVFASEPHAPDSQPSNTRPMFFPTMAEADVKLAAAAAISGMPIDPPITLDDDFVSNGIENVKGGLFANLKNALPLSFTQATDKAGGVAGPNFDITSLSREFGTVGGSADPLQSLKSGKFNPADFIGDSLPKLLGDIDLLDVLDATGLDFEAPGNATKVPGLNTELIYPPSDPNHTGVPDAIKTTYLWQPKLKNDPLDIFVPNDVNGLTLKAELLAPVGKPGQPTTDISGDLRNFSLYLISKGAASEFLIIHFEALTFKSHNGAKPDVDVRISKVEFGGALKFVSPLEELLKALGVGPQIDLSPTGVTAGYQIPLPSLAIGVLAIQNISLAASVTLPFNGEPVRARFSFCTREDPFMLSVTIFGGGGFFAIGVGVQGIEQVEAALEFGGNFSFDIGIASGGIHLLAGIYFKYTEQPSKSLTLTGYVRMGGELSVLGGIVSVSIELYLALSYVNEGGKDKAIGEATLTISVSVAFFSIDAEFSIRKEFGGGGDPTFAQSISQGEWNAYCDAYAA